MWLAALPSWLLPALGRAGLVGPAPGGGTHPPQQISADPSTLHAPAPNPETAGREGDRGGSGDLNAFTVRPEKKPQQVMALNAAPTLTH